MAVDTSNATATAGADPSRVRIAGAIKQASNSTGTSFEYLLATAKMESDFNPTAGASTSSAHGLYQFIDQTWLGTVKEAGAQLGYGNYADAITKSPSGSYSVSDPTARAAIMKLRDDPVASSAMAAALTQSNSFELTGKIGRRPTDSELYMAHFMGVGGAAKLISSAEDSPQASGAALFPNAAAANRSIFFDHSGHAYSVSQVYSVLSSRYASAASSPTARDAIATFGATPAIATGANGGAQVTKPAFLSSFPEVQPAAMASASLDNDKRLGAGRTDIPLVVSGRGASSTGVISRSRIMGQLLVDDLGCACNLGCLGNLGCSSPGAVVRGADPQRQRTTAARSVQRPHRRIQQLIPFGKPQFPRQKPGAIGGCLGPLTKRQ